MKKHFFILSILLALNSVCFADIKYSDKAGSWYNENPKILSVEINAYIDQAQPKKTDGRIIALISPHAGFKFSGAVAAYGYKLLMGKDIKTVVVIGFNHYVAHPAIAVCDYDSFKTPLGEIPIAKKEVEQLINSSPKIYRNREAFKDEQSYEMQLPFIQTVLHDFEIIIISIGDQSYENASILANSLHGIFKDRNDYIIIGSTDLCHYLPYDKNNEVDEYTLKQLLKFDPKIFYESSILHSNKLACGFGAVTATMMSAKKLGADKIEILKHANSGDVTKDKGKVVGYVSAVMTKKKEKNMLNENQRKELLKIARDTIKYHLDTGKKLEVKQEDPVLVKDLGAFVTLHENGQLRGCIGSIYPRGPLYLTIRDMSIESAFDDPRFMPLSKKDFEKIDIEISVLSPIEKIIDPSIIEVGKHGVIVDNGYRKGVYLPQVATETGWNREQFMNSLCGQKAGMKADAWKKGECDMYIFTAEVFGENES
ncbi:MAG: AmmeMemoRadiSam system protein B [Candidatus Omnitrophica bacterium]|nr:AmmeMemoRadiSam system protein B [Candidatus Omnitrophota bacterium]